MNTIGKRLREARKNAGYKSIQAFADAAGIAMPTYRAHETDLRGVNEETIKKYATLLKVDWVWLYTGRGEPSAASAKNPAGSKLQPDTEIMQKALELANILEKERNLEINIETKSEMVTDLYMALARQKEKGLDEDLSQDLIDHIIDRTSSFKPTIIVKRK